MATTLYLRNMTTNAANSGSTYKDLLAASGVAATSDTINTTASGTEILLQSFISGRCPVGGIANIGAITLNLYALESNTAANATVGARFYKRTPAGVETELLSTGRVNDDLELGNAVAIANWVFTPNQNRVFAEDDRLVCKIYASNFGTMAAGRTVTLQYNNGTASPNGSNIVLTETLTFKAEPANTYVRVGGVWKPAAVQVKNAGVWKIPVGKFVKTGGVWKPA